MSRAPFVAAALLLLAAPVFDGARLAAQRTPTLRIAAPPDNSYVTGEVTIRALIDPFGTPVDRVTFFADGRVVCTLHRMPYECVWDAGPGISEHQIRVVASLPGGGRLVQSIRTRKTGFTDEVHVDVVQVTVTVTDDRGEFVRFLPRSAFRVFEDDVRQRITAFASDNIPLEIVVALDVSQSMAEAMPTLKSAVKRFLGALKPENEVTLLGFNDNIFTLARRSTDREARIRAVDRLAPWGGTALYDVVLTSLNQLGRRPGRRALVVFTDGDDQSSMASLGAVEDRLETSDAVIYTIGLGRGLRDRTLRDILERMARVSGGRAFLTDDPGRLDEAFGQIVEELSSQYLVSYPPSNTRQDGTWRRIRVEVEGNYRVRAREGYRARSASSSARQP